MQSSKSISKKLFIYLLTPSAEIPVVEKVFQRRARFLKLTGLNFDNKKNKKNL